MTKPMQHLRHLYWQTQAHAKSISRELNITRLMIRDGINPISNAARCILSWERQHKYQCGRAKRAGFKIIDRDTLLKHKTSDTLFILGSGPSINAIDNKGWNEIAQHDSIGFNYFLAHPFVPTFFHMELLRNDMEMFRGCYSLRRLAYKDIPFMIGHTYLDRSNLTAADLDFIDNKTVTVPRHYFHAKAKDTPKIITFAQDKIAQLDDTFLLHHRGTVCLTISLGILLGYKRLVLAGVDLHNTGYFFCDERYACAETQPLQQRRCEASTSPNNTLRHATADPAMHPDVITIDHVLRVLNDTILTKRGIELYVYNKDSLLYPDFKAWHDRQL